MTEPIADLPYRVIDSAGTEYYVGVAAELRIDGHWEAWLEYVPDDESEPLLTGTETTQATRADIVRWADTLTENYVEGAFARAVPAITESRLVARRADVEAESSVTTAVDPAGLPDPFELYELLGQSGLRLRLRPLPRWTLAA